MGLVAISEVMSWLENFAPRELAESWDNVGLLMGDPTTLISKVMTCLTVTSDSADEAINNGVGLIVTHHPIMFKPVQSLRADSLTTKLPWRLARAGIAVYSPHTALDNCVGGINDGLTSRLGLVEVGPLRPTHRSPCSKIITFSPETDRVNILSAAFAAGAGRIGLYDECSFSSTGQGTFRGRPGSNPTVGETGRFEEVVESRMELICPNDRIADVLTAIRRAHSYEEVPIDVIALSPVPSGPGIGRLGSLTSPMSIGDFASLVALRLGAPATQFVGNPARIVQRIAICCGAGDDFLADARRAGADVLLTGEARFHRACEAYELGVGLVVAGHYATERPGVEDLADRLRLAFPVLEIRASRHEFDPLRLHNVR